MKKELFVSSSPHETKLAVSEDDKVVEVYFEREADAGLVGGIYKGRVTRVLPGMQSAFVDIGLERDAFLYVSDFYEESEEYEKMDTPVEERTGRGPSPTGADTSGEAPAQVATGPEGPPPPTQAPPPEKSEAVPASAPSQDASPAPESKRGGPRRRGRGGPPRRRRPESRRETEKPRESVEPAESFNLLPGESLALHGSGNIPETPEPSPQQALPSSPSPAESPVRDSEPVTESSPAVDEQPVDAVPEVEAKSSDGSEVSPPPEVVSTEAVPASLEGGTATGEITEVPSKEPPPIPAPVPTDAGPPEEPAHETTVSPAPPEVKQEAPEPTPKSEATESKPPEVERKYTLRESDDRPRFSAPSQVGKRPRARRGRYGSGRQRSRTPTPPVQISKVLKEGQEILVQIAREPLGTKGARITSHIALPGRYLVYMPTVEHIGVSRKIASQEQRLRLRNIILDAKGSHTGGLIVRTAAEGRPEGDIKADVRYLTSLWSELRSRAESLKSPALIHQDAGLLERVLRDLLSSDFRQIWVDAESDYERSLEFVSRAQPTLVKRVKLYHKENPLFEEFGIQHEIEKALLPKVWLKSGGYIVVNETEALVAIDVNTGKYVGRTNRLEDTIIRTNIDAVKEIVRQIRLRDLGGIIVIDFIDMDEKRNRNKVLQALEEALGFDRAPSKVLSFNDFGLVAITRKRVRQSLDRTLCTPCIHCEGSGWVKSVTTVCNEIFTEVQKMAENIDGNSLTLRVHPDVAKGLKSGDDSRIQQMEELLHKDVIVKSDPTVHQARFEVF